jgi:hypothetical protein
MPIVNSKKISTTGFDQDALVITIVGTSLLNVGKLTTTGDLANGIFADANNVSIRNNATIETSGAGAAGIFVQGNDAHIENHGSVHTTGDFFDPTPRKFPSGDEVFSEGIEAVGDRFYVANYGSVQVSGLFSSGLVGVGDNGLVVNYNVVDSSAIGSSAVVVVGKSQAINATSGEVTTNEVETTALLAVGDGASALNLGQITTNGAGSVGIEGVEGSTQLTNKGVISITADASVGMLGLADGNQITNFGLIEAKGTLSGGIFTRGFNVEISNAGDIVTEGELGLGITLGLTRAGYRPAGDGQIVNSGVIETVGDGAAGVVMIGDRHHLTNSGQISTDGGVSDFGGDVGVLRAAGVIVSGDDALLKNIETGVIESLNADSAAVELNVLKRSGLSNVGTSSEVQNSGLIEGANVAILGGEGQETVVNHGSIVGDVILGGGADTFVFGDGGSLDGDSDLFLGDGKDLVVIEDGAGTAEIADFVAGPASGDTIDVSAFKFESFADVVDAAQQDGSDLVIRLDQNDQVVLSNVSLNDLHESDFILMA